MRHRVSGSGKSTLVHEVLYAGLKKLRQEWKGNVDLENISVSLTPIGTYQELYVESIKWGKQVIVKSQSGGHISCYYNVNATLLDS